MIGMVATFSVAAALHFAYLGTLGKDRYKAENQDLGNIVQVEDFLYRNSPEKLAAVVGTSVSAHVSHPDLLNLSFSGGAALTVLELLSASHNPPKLIFLEANLLYKPVDTEVTERFTKDYRKSLPILQARYRPMSLLLGAISGEKSNSADGGKLASSTNLDHDVKETKLTNLVNMMAEPLPEKEIEDTLKLVLRNIETLEAKGSQVIPYFTPFDADITASLRDQEYRQLLERAFQGRDVVDFTVSDNTTFDGIHLCAEGVKDLSNQLAHLAKQGEKN